ncbi:MAG: hypothetical protein K6E67_02520 [Prevotella sp.]|nr:hypothetical protein [Prevotella sp.]
MKKIVLFLLVIVSVLPMKAQQTEMAQQRQQIQLAPEPAKKNFLKDYFKKYFQHLDVGVNLGTTGIGVDVSMPVHDIVCLRTGFNYMPRVEVPMTFGIQVGDDPTTSDSKFAKMASVLQDLTGNPVSDHVDMIGKAKMWNWNFLVDVYPLKHNKHWRVTAGFFLGPSTIAESYNKTESMASLVAVGIYNNMYNKLHGKTKRELASVKLVDLSVLGPEYKDLYFDIDMLYALQQGFDAAGRMGVILGTYVNDVLDKEGNVIHKKGEYYMMTPDDDDMVKADMKVNAFKPYIGVGYEGRLVKGNDRLTVAVDGGIMLWGGKPSLITHDGTDLIHDVEGITGKVGSYVDVMSKLSVYPTLSVRFAYTIF